MNHNPKLASSWKGRVLIEYFLEESKFPLNKIYKIDAKLNKALIDKTDNNNLPKK